jgi:hypothetical protein
MYCSIAKFHILCHFCLSSTIGIKIFFKVFLLVMCPNWTWNIELMFIIFTYFISIFVLSLIFYLRLASEYALYFNLCPYNMRLLYFLCYLIPWSTCDYTMNQPRIITSPHKYPNFILIFLWKFQYLLIWIRNSP